MVDLADLFSFGLPSPDTSATNYLAQNYPTTADAFGNWPMVPAPTYPGVLPTAPASPVPGAEPLPPTPVPQGTADGSGPPVLSTTPQGTPGTPAAPGAPPTAASGAKGPDLAAALRGVQAPPKPQVQMAGTPQVKAHSPIHDPGAQLIQMLAAMGRPSPVPYLSTALRG